MVPLLPWSYRGSGAPRPRGASGQDSQPRPAPRQAPRPPPPGSMPCPMNPVGATLSSPFGTLHPPFDPWYQETWIRSVGPPGADGGNAAPRPEGGGGWEPGAVG